MHYNCNEIPNVVKGSDYFMKVLYKQYVEDILCPGAQRPYSLPDNPKVNQWIITSMVITAFCLVTSFGLACITIVDSWQAYMRVYLSITYAFYMANLGLDIMIATEFARDYLKLTDDLDARVAGEDSNYTLDLARIGALVIVFAILKGVVIHVVNVVLVFSSIFLLPGHESRQRARKSGPISAEDRIAHPSLRQINSFDDVPRLRRLQSMHARRARAAARIENPTHQLSYEDSSPSPPPPPPPRRSRHQQRCTCVRRRRPRAPSPPPPTTPTPPTPPPSPSSPEVHATTVTTVAVVEAIDMAVAGPSGLYRATGSQESSEYLTTEL